MYNRLTEIRMLRSGESDFLETKNTRRTGGFLQFSLVLGKELIFPAVHNALLRET
ncbi:hypothetical protein J2S07_003831 [Robertmurraya andreesenii]|uniref:Uncharacterized protein n=1 Tax=Anoxybacillus andreesenii TaxID=1325932 RepID=A0ABT9V974_9BACL|nr:hypothetical protein [Robertmurraya andreesenii]